VSLELAREFNGDVKQRGENSEIDSILLVVVFLRLLLRLLLLVRITIIFLAI
jgi:hypothetical protein